MEEWQDIEEKVKSTRFHRSTKPNMKINQDSSINNHNGEDI